MIIQIVNDYSTYLKFILTQKRSFKVIFCRLYKLQVLQIASFTDKFYKLKIYTEFVEFYNGFLGEKYFTWVLLTINGNLFFYVYFSIKFSDKINQ